jgi:hypothetical protein
MSGHLSRAEVLTRLRRAAQSELVQIEISLLKKNKHAADYFDHKGPEVWIGWLESSLKGSGAKVMQSLANEADATKTLLRLSVDGDVDGGLYSYYERFGFERDPAGGEIMERPPRG